MIKDFVTIKKCIDFLDDNKRSYFIGMLLANFIGSVCYNISLSFVMRYIIEAVEYKSVNELYKAFFIAIVSFLGAVIIEPLATKTKKDAVFSMIFSLREELIKKIFKSKTDEFEKFTKGELQAVLIDETNNIRDIFLFDIPNLIFALMHGGIAIAIMFYYNYVLAIIAIVLGVVRVFVNKIYNKKISSCTERTQIYKETLLQTVIELMEGNPLLYDSNLQNWLEDFLDKKVKNYSTEKMTKDRISGASDSIDMLIEKINYLFILIVGFWIFEKGRVSLGIIISIISLQNNANFLFQNYHSFSLGLAKRIPAIQNILKVLRMSEEKKVFLPITRKIDSYDLVGISFSYPEKRIIENLSLHFRKGTFNIISGESGIGKTTLLKLIMALYKPQTGKRFINNIEYGFDSIINSIAYMGQKTSIFSTSIKNNLLIYNPNATDEEIISACKAAKAHDFIMKLGGYNYNISNDLDNISGGQKQRLALARVILSDKPIWIIDEGTANIDTFTERDIIECLQKEKKERIIIMVTHHSYLEHQADCIYRL